MTILLIACAILLLLYFQGFLTVGTKTALLFIGSLGSSSQHAHASFSGCSGKLHRILRFPASKAYTFSFRQELSNGSMEITILDMYKQPLLSFSKEDSIQELPFQKGQRYYLSVSFQRATGSFDLSWN